MRPYRSTLLLVACCLGLGGCAAVAPPAPVVAVSAAEPVDAPLPADASTMLPRPY